MMRETFTIAAVAFLCIAGRGREGDCCQRANLSGVHSGIASNGHGACRRTRSLWLPRNASRKPLRPSVDIRIRSAAASRAVSRITSMTLPCLVVLRHVHPVTSGVTKVGADSFASTWSKVNLPLSHFSSWTTLTAPAIAGSGRGVVATGIRTLRSETDPSVSETKPRVLAGTKSVISPDFLATGSEIERCSQSKP